MKFNKGQGALEYLLLIGGAVLIAVIVIALLVGMGSSSRKTAQDQADQAGNTINSTAIAAVLNSVSCTGTTCNVGWINNDPLATNTLVVNNIDANASLVGTTTTFDVAVIPGQQTAYIKTTKGNDVARSNTVTFIAN